MGCFSAEAPPSGAAERVSENLKVRQLKYVSVLMVRSTKVGWALALSPSSLRAQTTICT